MAFNHLVHRLHPPNNNMSHARSVTSSTVMSLVLPFDAQRQKQQHNLWFSEQALAGALAALCIPSASICLSARQADGSSEEASRFSLAGCKSVEIGWIEIRPLQLSLAGSAARIVGSGG